MAYEKQTWTTGEVITADKLNHIEDGIAGAGGSTIEPITITITYNDDTGTYTANKTYGDFSQEWDDANDHLMELADLHMSSVPCTITYNDESSDESSAVYNGLAVPAPVSYADSGIGLGLITYLDEFMEYDEDSNTCRYVNNAHGFIFCQHEANDAIKSFM